MEEVVSKYSLYQDSICLLDMRILLEGEYLSNALLPLSLGQVYNEEQPHVDSRYAKGTLHISHRM